MGCDHKMKSQTSQEYFWAGLSGTALRRRIWKSKYFDISSKVDVYVVCTLSGRHRMPVLLGELE